MANTTIIGIAGGSGSGKTTVTNEIMKNLEAIVSHYLLKTIIIRSITFNF